ncbi:MAG: hypothetical protein RL442_22 [Pseudomonadota bacterium]|jgi:hypothetical protein
MPVVPLKPFRTPIKAAAGQTSQLFNNPPPTGGLNLRDPISEMSPLDAIVLDNFIARQQGVELRKGTRVHTEALEGVTEFKSIFGYNAASSANSKLFAAFDGDIYDVTENPATVIESNTGSTSDQWWTTQYSTTSGSYLLAVSPGAGYWTYDPTNGWVDRTASCAGLPTNVRTVAVWKERVWFTVEGGSDVYYLDGVNAIQGTAVPFPMGSVLRNGGSVSALLNWTIDSGFSMDDYMAVIGTEGDIGIWVGTDPTSADTFGLKGVWYIGPVPKYGVYFTPFGGDVMILSQQGLIPLSKIVSGQYNEAAANMMPASKIQPALVTSLTTLKDVASWDVMMVPKESILIIKLPPNVYGQFSQFVMNTITGAWSTFSNMNMICSTLLGGQLYYADNNGQVVKGLFEQFDGADIDGENGSAIEGDVQASFNAYNTPAQLKKFQMVRPIFVAPTAPSVKLQLNTQYALNNVTGAPAFADPTTGIWDDSNWNQAYFAGNQNTYQAWVGVFGLGYYGSVRMKVKGLPGTIFTSAHVMSEMGGVM